MINKFKLKFKLKFLDMFYNTKNIKIDVYTS